MPNIKVIELCLKSTHSISHLYIAGDNGQFSHFPHLWLLQTLQCMEHILQQFTSPWCKSFKYVLRLYFESNDLIMSQFCTCQNSCAVMTCAKWWPDWSIRINSKQKGFSQKSICATVLRFHNHHTEASRRTSAMWFLQQEINRMPCGIH